MGIKQELGKKIKRMRIEKGYTQEKLSELIDVSQKALSSIETGENFVKAETLDKILEALKIAKERRPDLKIDGEFQLDTAIDPAVAAKKLDRPSDVAGKANVLIFPELNAANIAVKLVQRFAHGSAYGHTLSGFAKPVADSSRGATVEEIVGDIAMLVLAAGN